MDVTNRYVVIKTHVDGSPSDGDFELKSCVLSLALEPGSNDVIIKNLYVSIDPYQLNRMKRLDVSQKLSSLASPTLPGQEIDAYGVGRVLVSGNPEFEEGDLVGGLISWGEYTVIKPGGLLRKLDPMGFPLSYHVGVLAFSGLTAYAGFFEVCKPKKGETVFVSAASGSVGSLVGQYAKLLGCYVVGCAGTKEKVAMLTEELGFDAAFNYKEVTDLKETLKSYFPNGIDIYFDNVGGEMQEAAIENMNAFGRVAACGAISHYTDKEKKAAPNMMNIVYKRINIRGFLAIDFLDMFPEFIKTTTENLQSGKMKSIEDISKGVESIPSAFVGLFQGKNVGKKIVQIAEDE